MLCSGPIELIPGPSDCGRGTEPALLVFFDDTLRRLFKDPDPPVAGTKQEVFEQIMRFTLSNDFALTKQSVKSLMRDCTRRAV
jgi:hypothetical protein